MFRRYSDHIRIGLLAGAAVLATWHVALAQSQDTVNATLGQQVLFLSQRLDKIDSMINAVLVALVLNFIAQVVRIKRGPTGRNE